MSISKRKEKQTIHEKENVRDKEEEKKLLID
jgi:hypothetical protein